MLMRVRAMFTKESILIKISLVYKFLDSQVPFYVWYIYLSSNGQAILV